MKVFIIADDTRIEQERLFLWVISKFSKLEFVYCKIGRKDNDFSHQYTTIRFVEYGDFLAELKISTEAPIIFFNYYGNLGDFDFLWRKLILFGHFLFYETPQLFKNLKKVYVFDFWRHRDSYDKIRTLFDGVEISFQSQICYPAAINYLSYRHIDTFQYDIFIPLWWKFDFWFFYDFIRLNKKFKVLVWSVNLWKIYSLTDEETENFNIFYKKISTIQTQNINFIDNTSIDIYAQNLAQSRVIVFPLLPHKYNITRISDALALGKIVFSTECLECNEDMDHINTFFGAQDCILKIDNTFKNALDTDQVYKKMIFADYDRKNSIMKLALDVYTFLLK